MHSCKLKKIYVGSLKNVCGFVICLIDISCMGKV